MEDESQKDLTGVEVLQSKGGTTVRGKVKGKKQDQSGNQVTTAGLDEPLYIVDTQMEQFLQRDTMLC